MGSAKKKEQNKGPPSQSCSLQFFVRKGPLIAAVYTGQNIEDIVVIEIEGTMEYGAAVRKCHRAWAAALAVLLRFHGVQPIEFRLLFLYTHLDAHLTNIQQFVLSLERALGPPAPLPPQGSATVE